MKSVAAAVIGVLLSCPVSANEKVVYTYDAQGRLVKTVVVTSTVNNGTTTTYTHDNADNRKSVVVTGAPQ